MNFYKLKTAFISNLLEFHSIFEKKVFQGIARETSTLLEMQLTISNSTYLNIFTLILLPYKLLLTSFISLLKFINFLWVWNLRTSHSTSNLLWNSNSEWLKSDNKELISGLSYLGIEIVNIFEIVILKTLMQSSTSVPHSVPKS